MLSAVSKRTCWSGRGRSPLQTRAAAAVRDDPFDPGADHPNGVGGRIRLGRSRPVPDAMLVEADGNRVKAAGILDIARSSLYRKIDAYGIRPFE